MVRAAARGQGVGSALLETVIERARAGHWAELGVSTMLNNERAIKLYKKMGFVDESLLLEQHL